MEHKEVLKEYYRSLVDSLFKLIPIFNNEPYKNSFVKLSDEEAFKNYKIYLSNLIIEMIGNNELFCSGHSIKILNILEGMLIDLEIGECQKNKRLVMECIRLCNKIIEGV